MSDFERGLLKRVAEAFGISYEQLSEDYAACDTAEIEAVKARERALAQLDRFYAAEWHAALANAIYAMAIWTIESYCGYNPQRLLAPPRYQSRS